MTAPDTKMPTAVRSLSAAATPPKPLLQVRHLSVAFPGHLAVNDISFDINQGETLALVGESGCGKSATSFALMRLLPRGTAIAGEVNFAGTDLFKASAQNLRDIRGKKIGLILQEPMTSLNPVLTIGEQIAEALVRHEKLGWRQAHKRAVELLDLVRIPDASRRYHDFPHNMSGGMRQRVMIAIAVSCNPQLIIADEPTTALDVTLQSEVLELLDSLRRQLHMALLLITHDLGVVAQWADRVAVMYAGRIVEQAEANALFERPVHPYSQGLVRATLRLDDAPHYSHARLNEIPGSVASAAGDHGCAFAPRCAQVTEDCRRAPPTLVPYRDRLVACRLAADRPEEIDRVAAGR
jgi:peptide/nickel transport system ATP-binding protein